MGEQCPGWLVLALELEPEFCIVQPDQQRNSCTAVAFFWLASNRHSFFYFFLSFFLFFRFFFSLPPSSPRFNFLRIRVTLPSYLNRMDVSIVSFLTCPFATFDGDEIAQVQLIDDIALLPFYIRTVHVSCCKGGKSCFLYILFGCKFNKSRFVIDMQFFALYRCKVNMPYFKTRRFMVFIS